MELFRERLENILDRNHELYRLAGLIDWDAFDREFGAFYAAQKGRPGIPIRLMVGLAYLGHAYGLSDEAVVAKWVENPYWQYFCGETYFQHRLPMDSSSMSRWRKRIGEEGCEKILTETLQAGLRSGAVKDSSLKRINVDTTVQPKAIRYPPIHAHTIGVGNAWCAWPGSTIFPSARVIPALGPRPCGKRHHTPMPDNSNVLRKRSGG